MGSWDTESFGNDTAGDWAYSLEEKKDLSFVEVTLQKLLDAGDAFVEAPDAEEAVAAAEVLARLMGNSGVKDTYTETVDNWVAAHQLNPSDEILQKAQKALERITKEPSELRDLWKESGELEVWLAKIEDLQQRLKRI